MDHYLNNSFEAEDQDFLLVERVHADAKLPVRASTGAVGYDLTSIKAVTVPKGGKAWIPTGLVIVIPEGLYGRIAPRSGLAFKNHISVGAGVIDQDYRGEVGVLLFNHGLEDFKVAVGDRVAQLILEMIFIAVVKEAKDIRKNHSTKRDQDGFGSTGVSSDKEIVTQSL